MTRVVQAGFRAALVSVTAAVLAFASAARADDARTITLRLAHFVDTAHPAHARVLVPWSGRLARDSGGRLRVSIHPAGELGRDPPGQLARLKAGSVDIVWGLPGYTAALFPRTLLASLPDMAKAAVPGTRMLWRVFQEHLAPEFGDVKVLGLWMNEPALLLTRRLQVREPDDLAGRVIRPPTVVGDRLLEAWGARVAKSRIEQSLPGLREGSLDGVLMDAGAIGAFGLQREARFALDGLPSVAAVFYLLMNRRAWDALPADLQAALGRESGERLSLEGACAYAEQGAAALAAMRGAGVVIARPAADARTLFAARASALALEEVTRLEAAGIPARKVVDSMWSVADATTGCLSAETGGKAGPR